MPSEVTVVTVLSQVEFKEFKVLAGRGGLATPVKSVTVMDALDFMPYAKGGEIILSSGYLLKEHPDQLCHLIREMKRVGNAALFVKVKRYFDELPQAMLAVADELDFPVIDVPARFSYIEVINPVLSKLVFAQSEALQYSEDTLLKFTDLVIQNADTVKIIETLSEVIEQEVCFYDAKFQKLYGRMGADQVDLQQPLIDLLQSYQHYTIGVQSEVYGYIIYPFGPAIAIPSNHRTALMHANTALILDIQKKISSDQIRERHRHEFVQDIMLNNIKTVTEVRNRARVFNWDLQGKHRALIVDFDEYKKHYELPEYAQANQVLDEISEQMTDRIAETVRKYYPAAMYTKLSDSVAFIIEADSQRRSALQNCCEDLHQMIPRTFGYTVTIGIGTDKADVMDLHYSYEEAQRSVKIGRQFYKENATVDFNELGIFTLLYDVQSHPMMTEFAINQLQPLIAYDQNHQGNLLHTLRVIVDHNWQLKQSAQDLFIHYNTIKYRYKQITDLLDLDLDDAMNRLNLSMALKLYQLQL